MSEEDFYECRQCGACCQGETTVSLDQADRERLSAYLGLPYAEVEQRYLRVSGNTVQMKTVAGHCIFYENGCTVHPGKPWRCRQWPLHPSMVEDPANFTAITSSCPGFKDGLTHAEFVVEFRRLSAK